MHSSSESRQIRTPVYVGYEQMPMCGINVQLPLGLKPYPTQKLMMIKILTSLRNHLNALIESPTGSGKTLALLASSLAWLADYKRQRTEARDKCPVHQRGSSSKRPVVGVADSASAPSEQKVIAEKENSATSNADCGTISLKNENDTRESPSPVAILNAEEEFDQDFVADTLGKRRASSLADGSSSTGKRSRTSKEADEEADTGCCCMPRVRVYYGTRTHKQISQVVKEFSRLPFAGEIKHTILASREQSCINKKARASNDLTGYCRELLGPEGLGCSCHNALRPKYDKDYKMRNYLSDKAPAAWDIEDLVTALSAAAPSAMCPYFASNRILNEDADLIFCPFNYLIDPIIRDSSDMKLKNSVVILDEAHNVEDTCRDSASFAFTEKEIYDALINLRETQRKAIDALSHPRVSSEGRSLLEELGAHYNVAVAFVEELQRWFKDIGGKVEIKSTAAPKHTAILSWADLNASLLFDGGDPRRVNLLFKEGSEEYKTLFAAIVGLTERGDAEKEDKLIGYRPLSSTAVVIEKFIIFLKYYTKNDYNTTYRTFISAERNESPFQRNNKKKSFEPPNQSRGADEWLSAKNASNGDSQGDFRPIHQGYHVTVNLWCMSPAVSFLDAFSESRSVILASGTLCPTETFQSELGVDFKARMEGDQVIPRERIFASVIPVGPSGRPLRATYEQTSKSGGHFLPELSQVIKSVCDIVPHGVLCFFPSYRLMEQLLDHMQGSGVLRHISRIKEVITEPRRSSDLSDTLRRFDEAVATPKNFGGDKTGALMLAVFRGKVSEGIDFADNLARCVITVGIPYPNAMDEQVIEKKRYNTENEKTLKLLSGDQWYTIQAYRALNQALGRCLRHREDWGALVLVDERFLPSHAQNASSKKLSKWIRQQLLVFPSFEQFTTGLNTFVSKMSDASTLNAPESSLL